MAHSFKSEFSPLDKAIHLMEVFTILHQITRTNQIIRTAIFEYNSYCSLLILTLFDLGQQEDRPVTSFRGHSYISIESLLLLLECAFCQSSQRSTTFQNHDTQFHLLPSPFLVIELLDLLHQKIEFWSKTNVSIDDNNERTGSEMMDNSLQYVPLLESDKQQNATVHKQIISRIIRILWKFLKTPPYKQFDFSNVHENSFLEHTYWAHLPTEFVSTLYDIFQKTPAEQGGKMISLETKFHLRLHNAFFQILHFITHSSIDVQRILEDEILGENKSNQSQWNIHPTFDLKTHVFQTKYSTLVLNAVTPSPHSSTTQLSPIQYSIQNQNTLKCTSNQESLISNASTNELNLVNQRESSSQSQEMTKKRKLEHFMKVSANQTEKKRKSFETFIHRVYNTNNNNNNNNETKIANNSAITTTNDNKKTIFSELAMFIAKELVVDLENRIWSKALSVLVKLINLLINVDFKHTHRKFVINFENSAEIS